MAFSSLRAPMADMPLLLSLCLIYTIFFFFFPFHALSVSYRSPPPPPPYSSGEGFRSPPPPHASGRQGFSSPPSPPPHASGHQGFSSPPPPPPHASGREGFSSPPPPPPHAPGHQGFSSPPPPPPHRSGRQSFRPPPPPPPYPSDQDLCQPYGSLFCSGQYIPIYICSPKITSSTPAILVTHDFSGAGGGGTSACDGKYHNNSDLIVGLSTGWYNSGLPCGKMIKIMASIKGRSVLAKVVDECDSMRGCDEEHSGQPPCENNIINGSDAVWTALGLDKKFGEVNVTWSTVMGTTGCDSNNYIVHIM